MKKIIFIIAVVLFSVGGCSKATKQKICEVKTEKCYLGDRLCFYKTENICPVKK